MKEGSMYCEGCGAFVPMNAKACPYCGLYNKHAYQQEEEKQMQYANNVNIGSITNISNTNIGTVINGNINNSKTIINNVHNNSKVSSPSFGDSISAFVQAAIEDPNSMANNSATFSKSVQDFVASTTNSDDEDDAFDSFFDEHFASKFKKVEANSNVHVVNNTNIFIDGKEVTASTENTKKT